MIPNNNNNKLTEESILQEFNKLGYSPFSLIDKAQMQRILNTLVQNNAERRLNSNVFNPEVAEQLWENCVTNSKGEVILGDYVDVILRAHSTLDHKIAQIEGIQIPTLRQLQSKTEVELAEARKKTWEGVDKDHILSDKINSIASAITGYEADIEGFKADKAMLTIPFDSAGAFHRPKLDSMAQTIVVPNSLPISRAEETVYTSAAPEHKASLYTLFWLGFLFLLLEMIVMTKKYHFLNLLSALSILAIFGLGNFSSSYVKFVLTTLVLSQAQDISWLICKIAEFWNLDNYSEFSRLLPAFSKVVLVLILGIIVVKVIQFHSMGIFIQQIVILILLVPFLKNREESRYRATIIGNVEVILTGSDSHPIMIP